MTFFSVAIFVTFAFGIWMLYGLLALWVSSRSWHWFLRVVVLVASVVPMLAIKAPDLMLVLLASNLTIFGPVAWAARATRIGHEETTVESAEAPSFRWRVSDLLLMTAVVAMVVVIFQVNLDGQNFTKSMAAVFGSLIGVVMLTAMALTIMRSRWLWRITAVTCLVGIGVALDQFVFDAAPPGRRLIPAGYGMTDFLGAARPMSLTSGTAMFLMLAVFRFRHGNKAGKPTDTGIASLAIRWAVAFAWWLVVLATLSVVICVGLVCSELWVSYPAVTTADRNAGIPNGYVELIEAGEVFLNSNILQTTREVQPGSLTRKEVVLYRDTFKKVATALDRKLLTGKTWSDADPQDLLEGNSENSLAIRSVARALGVKSRQELHDGKADIAIRDGIAAAKLRLPLARTDLVIDQLMGLALESIGMYAIERALPLASKESLLETDIVLKELDALPTDAAKVYRSEFKTLWRHSNWKFRVLMLIMQDPQQINLPQINERFRVCQTQRHQLMLQVGLERFHRDHDCYPKTLTELTPGYLTAVPVDPYSKSEPPQPMRYLRGDDPNSYTLYSIGADGVDDGGALNDDLYWDEESGDINFAQRCQISSDEFLQNAQSDPLDGADPRE